MRICVWMGEGSRGWLGFGEFCIFLLGGKGRVICGMERSFG